MTQFDEREQAFENKFGHDEEIEFKISTRMARLFGQWAAQQLGMSAEEAHTYAGKAVDLEVAKSGRAHLLDSTEKDFQAKGVALSRHRLEHEMEECYRKAREELA